MTFGLDLLGSCSPHWNVDATIKAFPPGWALGAFGPGWPNAFGTDTKNIAKICTETRVSAVRFHAFWSPNHDLVPLSFIQKWAPHYENFAKKFPDIKVYLSPSCEYGRGATSGNLKAIMAVLTRLAPHCVPVLSPQGGSVVLPGVETEWHGTNSAGGKGKHASLGTEDSTDGNSITDIDAALWIDENKTGDYCYFWGGTFNMNPGNNIPHPSARTFSPGFDYMKGVVYLANPLGIAPTPIFKAIPLAKPNLYKTFAEWDGNTTQRDFKPMLWLVNEPHDPIEVVTFDGQHICNLGHFEKDTRWYSGLGDNLWAYQMQQIAIQKSGSPWGYAKTSSGAHYELGNLAFRSPFYQ